MGSNGGFNSMALVRGQPAISYFSYQFTELKFARYDGELWHTMRTGAGGAYYNSLAEIGGLPAISYQAFGPGDLKYAYHDGTTWREETIASEGEVGLFTSLAEVDGRPAISYFDQSNYDLKYAVRQPAANGGFTYIPEDSFCGTDTFTYRASDGAGLSEPATVTITVLCNNAPVAADDHYTTPAGVPLTVPAPGVLTNDHDAEGDPLTILTDTLPAHGT
jgi:hypothetical protein